MALRKSSDKVIFADSKIEDAFNSLSEDDWLKVLTIKITIIKNINNSFPKSSFKIKRTTKVTIIYKIISII